MLSMSIYTDEMLVDPLINTMLGLVINSKVTYGKAGQAGTHKLSKVSTHRNHKLSMKMVPLRPHTSGDLAPGPRTSFSLSCAITLSRLVHVASSRISVQLNFTRLIQFQSRWTHDACSD